MSPQKRAQAITYTQYISLNDKHLVYTHTHSTALLRNAPSQTAALTLTARCIALKAAAAAHTEYY